MAARLKGPDGLRHIGTEDPKAFISELSRSELSCLSESNEISRVLDVIAPPALATPEGERQLVGCLERETLLRMYVSDLIPDSGHLSVETSECIRAEMREFDLRSAILQQWTRGQVLITACDSFAFMQSLTSLSDDEWEYAAPAIVWGPDDEGMHCIAESMRGPRTLAETLASQDETAASKVSFKTVLCGAEEVQNRTNEARPFPNEQAYRNGQGAAANSGPIAPLDVTSPDTLASELSDSEFACLSGFTGIARVLEVIQAPGNASPEDETLIANCLEDETFCA